MGCKLPRPGAARGKSSSEDLTAGHGKRGDAEAALLHQGVRRTLRNDPGVGTARTTGHRKWRPELGGSLGVSTGRGERDISCIPRILADQRGGTLEVPQACSISRG